MNPKLAVLLARIKTPLTLVGVFLCLSTFVHGNGMVALVGGVLLVIGYTLMFVRVGQGDPPPPRTVLPPMNGRLVAVNSPADKVPSHGIDAYGQTYAIDLLVHPDAENDWRGVHSRPLARPAKTFPGFGQPVLAPADGVVVRASDWQRDHWSRNSWAGLIYLFAEGSIRELGGPRFILGNHLILDLGDGTYAALAHLKRGSIKVRTGQRVRAGEVIAECGNSGNTSEPHVHFHLMDSPRPLVARGLPFAFEGRELPHNCRPFTVTGQEAEEPQKEAEEAQATAEAQA
ncbi:M23 family metallopeptidase [Actinomadura barringtoniae]|uniref:M23 family metallopeptidase n=1 Tax=Actinomadura barringtoniae TaxID=1427535 RepID=A0A939PJ00_9ACTN|nr:M23 family metallopeptidase [Actinomadura barringtoniae]MBO2450064.1 M23 family metallopeptidase [Actinomadura barringtoniae]